MLIKIKGGAAWLARHEIWLLAAAAPLLLFPSLTKYAPWIGLAFVLLAWLARWIAYHRLTLRTPIDLPILCLLLLTGLGVWVSPAPQLSWNRAWGLVFGFAVYYGFVNWTAAGSTAVKSTAANTSRRLKGAVYLLAGLTLGAAALSLLGTDWGKVRLFNLPGLYERLPVLLSGLSGSGIGNSELFNPRWVGITMGFLAPVFLALSLFSGDRRLRWVSGLTLVVAVSLLLLSQAVQGLVALAAGSLFLLIWRWWAHRKWLILILLLIGLAIFVSAVIFTGEQRLAAAAAYLLSLENPVGIAVALRLDIWSRALAMLHDLPYSGIGLNAFPVVQANFYPGFALGQEPHAHNLFLQTALDFGLPGLVVFTWLFAAWFIAVRQRSRISDPAVLFTAEERVLLAGLAAGVTAYLAHGLIDSLMLGAKPAAALWLILAMGMATPAGILVNQERQEPVRKLRLAWLPLAILALAVLASLVWAPAALPMNLGAFQAHQALVQGESPAAEGALQRTVAADPGRIFAYELLGRLHAGAGEPSRALDALRMRVALDGNRPDPLGTYFPPASFLRQIQGTALKPGQSWDDLLQVYTNWMVRYPQQAEHAVKVSLVWSEIKGDPEKARQVLLNALAAGAEPAQLLEYALTKLPAASTP